MKRPALAARRGLATGLLVAGLTACGVLVQPSRQDAERMVQEAYRELPPALATRVQQDDAQRTCSQPGFPEAVSQDRSSALSAAARTSIRYPDSGALIGDWKAGERLAKSVTGGRIRNGLVEVSTANGGNCYACHALDPRESNAGNLGPSLANWGLQHGRDAAAIRYTYESIYNRWAFQPCSAMPRFGSNGFLSPEQVAHLVAYLVDPASPVNRR